MRAPPAPFIPAERRRPAVLVIMFVVRRRPGRAGMAAIEPFRAGRDAARRDGRCRCRTRASTSSRRGGGPRRRAHPVAVPRRRSTTTPSTRSSTFMRRAELADGDDPDPRPRRRDGPRAADATAFAHRDAPVMVAAITPVRGRRPSAGPRGLDDGALTRRCGRTATGVYATSSRPRARTAIREAYPGRHVRAAGRGQAPLRPDEPVPPQPEHPARRGLVVQLGRRRPSRHRYALGRVPVSSRPPQLPSRRRATGALRWRGDAAHRLPVRPRRAR